MANVTRRVVQGGAEIDPITLTGENIASKSVLLERIPTNPGEVSLGVVGAGPQFYGDDYIVEGRLLQWSGLGLDEMGLEVGDKLMIIY